MPFNSKDILRDLGRLPIPQYFNSTTDTYEATRGRDGATFVQIRGGAAKEPFSGTTNTTHIFTEPMYGFTISNDGDYDLTFTINSYSFRVKPGEVFSEFFDPFTEVSVTTTSPFRAYGRS